MAPPAILRTEKQKGSTQVTFEHWYLFPVSILIATTAMASGIGGAVFFSPLFMLVLKLEPVVAVGTALATELFGFSSGVYAYWRERLIDYKVGLVLLMFSVPAAIVGTLASDAAPAALLKTVFAVGVVYIGSQLFAAYRREQAAQKEIESEAEQEHESELVDRRGRVFRYTVCNKRQGMAFAAVGGAFLGMISVGWLNSRSITWWCDVAYPHLSRSPRPSSSSSYLC